MAKNKSIRQRYQTNKISSAERKNLMEHKMKLMPYVVEGLQTETQKIPYGINLCQAPEIWEKGEKGSGIVVAVLDTGIDRNHPDLKDNIIDGRDFTSGFFHHDDFQDRAGHGTHVAGTIAANGKIQGVAPEAKLLIGKVLGNDGSGGYQGIIDGINWAANWEGQNGEKCRIINMSLGGSYNHKGLQEAILDACAKGIMVVVASGNEGDANEDTFEYGYPALYNECITVAACDENRRMAYFSNNHLQVDVTAAGVNVLSTYPESTYARLSGTSMATPHISGILALLIKMGETKFRRMLTESEIFGLLTQVCCSLGNKASNEGHGLPELSRFFESC
jgi:major intracellular serine protease